MNILVVDDDSLLRRSLVRLLRGNRVVTAANGKEALDLLRQSHFDAVLSDVDMPVMSGAGLYAALERELPHLLPRTVIWSGGSSSDALQELEEKGIPVWKKPSDLEVILVHLSKFEGPCADCAKEVGV